MNWYKKSSWQTPPPPKHMEQKAFDDGWKKVDKGTYVNEDHPDLTLYIKHNENVSMQGFNMGNSFDEYILKQRYYDEKYDMEYDKYVISSTDYNDIKETIVTQKAIEEIHEGTDWRPDEIIPEDYYT